MLPDGSKTGEPAGILASSLIYQLAEAVCSEGFVNPCRIITGLPRNEGPVEGVIGLRSGGGGGDSLPGIDSYSRGDDEHLVLLR